MCFVYLKRVYSSGVWFLLVVIKYFFFLKEFLFVRSLFVDNLFINMCEEQDMDVDVDNKIR